MSAGTTKPFYIVCADDEPDILGLYEEAIRSYGFEPIPCQNPAAAMEAVNTHHRDICLIISDYKFDVPDFNGIDLRSKLLHHKDIPFVIVSGVVSREMALEALQYKIDAFFDKPLDLTKFKTDVERLSKARRADIEETRLIEETFFEEAEGLLQEFEKQILDLGGASDKAAALNNIFRLTHTVKGSSTVLGNTLIKDYAHEFEEFLKRLQVNPDHLTEAHLKILFSALDTLQNLLNGIKKGETLQPPSTSIFKSADMSSAAANSTGSTAQAKASSDESKSVRVPLEVLDEIEHLTAEVTIQRNMISKALVILQKEMPLHPLVNALGSHFTEMSKMQAVIQSNVAKVRTVSFGDITRPLNRIVRDLERKIGKKAKLRINGSEIRVDHETEAVLSQCFVHLVRNSFDHGVEDPATRQSAGKPEVGDICISIAENMERYTITVKDDGRGINRKKIKEKAIEKGLMSKADLEQLADSDVLGLIFSPGFSTAETVTDVSGRGVGTDMVKSAIEKMGGEVRVSSEDGKGSEVCLMVPKKNMSVSLDTVLIRSGERTFAIPRENIFRLLNTETTPEQQFHRLEGSFQFELDGDILILASLDEILSGVKKAINPKDLGRDLVVCTVRGSKFVLAVEQIIDSEEIVVRPMPEFINTKGLFRGGALLDDGRVGLVLDVVGVSTALKIDASKTAPKGKEITEAKSEATSSFLLVENDDEQRCAIPQESIARLEEIRVDRIQKSGEQRYVLHAGEPMPLRFLSHSHTETKNRPAEDVIPVVIIRRPDASLEGLCLKRFVDIASFSAHELKRQDDSNFVIVNEKIFRIIDVATESFVA
jgi:two-component system chemotaxis sensor kinase CheA